MSQNPERKMGMVVVNVVDNAREFVDVVAAANELAQELETWPADFRPKSAQKLQDALFALKQWQDRNQ